ncbi:MAG: hypothetical protein ABSD21_11025 [Rhizomicrobium sp.]|jgi:hypothetical protein
MTNYSVEDDLCSDEGLRLVFDYLLPCIETNSTITYGEIAGRLTADLDLDGQVFSTHPGHVVGTLMHRILEIDNDAPLLNLLVVNIMGKPGEGADQFIRERFGLPERDAIPNRADLIEQEANRVFAFKRWPRIYKRLFKADPPAIDPLARVKGTEADGMPPSTTKGGYGGTAESKEHKALKAYVLANPACIGAPVNPGTRKDELMLLSGDEVDVFFESRDAAYLVEVKSVRSNERDFERGVYQCVKYRAVFQAQCARITPDLAVHAILALEEEPPGHIKTLAKNNWVKVQVVKRARANSD